MLVFILIYNFFFRLLLFVFRYLFSNYQVMSKKKVLNSNFLFFVLHTRPIKFVTVPNKLLPGPIAGTLLNASLKTTRKPVAGGWSAIPAVLSEFLPP